MDAEQSCIRFRCKEFVQNSIRLPLAGLAPPRVLMCSASMGAEGSVTLQLREAVQAPDATGSLDGALTIGYPDPEMLADMLGTFQGASTGGTDSDAGSFDLLQDSNGSSAGATLRATTADQIEHLTGALLAKANSSSSGSSNGITTGTSTVTIKAEPGKWSNDSPKTILLLAVVACCNNPRYRSRSSAVVCQSNIPVVLVDASIPSLLLSLGLPRLLCPYGRPKRTLRAGLSGAILMT
uniref:Uncharacterized protein n=1 Tax=Anopheles maculatus TaxID=74869 RepID=A0A182SU22_9DIPT